MMNFSILDDIIHFFTLFKNFIDFSSILVDVFYYLIKLLVLRLTIFIQFFFAIMLRFTRRFRFCKKKNKKYNFGLDIWISVKNRDFSLIKARDRKINFFYFIFLKKLLETFLVYFGWSNSEISFSTYFGKKSKFQSEYKFLFIFDHFFFLIIFQNFHCNRI